MAPHRSTLWLRKIQRPVDQPWEPVLRVSAASFTAIRYARENHIPLLGTRGGFQHITLEFARNVARIAGAAHAENNPYASVLFISRLACSLSGKTMDVTVAPDTTAGRAMGIRTLSKLITANSV